MNKYDVMHFCFNSEIRKRERNAQNNPFNTSRCTWSISGHSDEQKMCWIVRPFCFLTIFSRFFSLCNGFWNCLHGNFLPVVLIASLRSCRFANCSCWPSYTKSCRISQMQQPKGLKSGEYNAHSSAAMKSGVFCCRNCCVAFARCDGALSCVKTKSLIFKSLWCLVSTSSSISQWCLESRHWRDTSVKCRQCSVKVKVKVSVFM